MYEKALEIDQYHVLTLCCYADMLSDRFNPLRDDARADAMLALARSKAAGDSQRACVAFAKRIYRLCGSERRTQQRRVRITRTRSSRTT